MCLNFTKDILNMKLWLLTILMFLSTTANSVEVKQIDLFIEHGMIVKNQGYGRDIVLNIHYVDSVDRVEKQISSNLPSNRNKAAAIMKRRIAETDIGKRVAKAYLPALKAAKLGIQRIPAAVINNRQGIFYGSNDIAEILSAAQKHR